MLVMNLRISGLPLCVQLLLGVGGMRSFSLAGYVAVSVSFSLKGDRIEGFFRFLACWGWACVMDVCCRGWWV